MSAILTWLELAVWIGCLLVNFYLMSKKLPTISERIHAWLPQKKDYIVMIGLVAIVGVIWGLSAAVVAIRWCVVGHWFWHED